MTATIQQAIQGFYSAYDIPQDGGKEQQWVRIDLGPIPMVLPNFDARRQAMAYHDSHHVATGYEGTMIGECEISAWELAAGCGRYWPAWLYGLFGVATGLVVAPHKTWRAFLRGRHNQSTYGMDMDRLMNMSVEELRERTKTNRPIPTPTWRDTAAFAAVVTAVLSTPTLVAATAMIML